MPVKIGRTVFEKEEMVKTKTTTTKMKIAKTATPPTATVTKTKKTKTKTKTKKKIEYSPEVLALKETYFSLFKKTPRGRKCNDVAWLKEKINGFQSGDGTTEV